MKGVLIPPMELVREIKASIGSTNISSIGDGTLTGAILTIKNTTTGIDSAIGTTDISDIGDGTVKGAIHAVNELSGKAVRYDTDMTLSSSQQEQARKNIGALINLKDTATQIQYRLGIENGIMYIEDAEEEE